MVDDERQLPSSSATGWSIDLEAVGGPRFVVLRLNESDARDALARYLVDIGAIANTIEAERVVGGAQIESVAVVW